MIRIPKPSYLKSRLTARRTKPDAALYQVLQQFVELYQLGEIESCHQIPRSLSFNFFVKTSQGKFVFRQQHLTKEDVAYEHQVLDYLQQRDFPAPRMLSHQSQAWLEIDGALYSLYEFEPGYCPTNFLWWPSTRRTIITQYGRTLAEYHQAVTGLVPSAYKWNGYHPTEHKRWYEGEWFRQTLTDIRPLLQKSTAVSTLDDFVRTHIEEFDKMLRLETVVERCEDLAKLVIHGDYAPWNVLFRGGGQPPFVLDFNEARLDLKIYDIMLATFWFAWRGHYLDQDKVQAFQAGYCEAGQLNEVDINLAGSVFRWIMARSMVERLHKHYLGPQVVFKGPAGLERQYQMCVFAEQQPGQLVAGLNGRTKQ